MPSLPFHTQEGETEPRLSLTFSVRMNTANAMGHEIFPFEPSKKPCYEFSSLSLKTTINKHATVYLFKAKVCIGQFTHYTLQFSFLSKFVFLKHMKPLITLQLYKHSSTSCRIFCTEELNTLRTRSFKLFKSTLPGFLTILTL